MFARRLPTGFQLSVSVQVNHRYSRWIEPEPFAQRVHHSSQPHLWYGSGAREFEHQDFIDFACPLGLRPFAEIPPTDQPGFEVVGAEIRGAGLRVVERDYRNMRLAVLAGHHGAEVLVDLVLDHQIHPITNELLNITERHCWLVAVVQDHQFDIAAPLGSDSNAVGRLPRKQRFDTGSTISDLPFRLPGTPVEETVLALTQFFHHSVSLERVQQP